MTQPRTRRTPRPLVLPFPAPGESVRHAYRELHIALNGTDEQKQALGNLSQLPRPWDPATCLAPGLRHGLWRWLEDVVIWLNQEYTWDVAGVIPTCWPAHPHLVHEIAMIADQRRRAGLAMTSDAMEEWHRYCLPAFVDRQRGRLKTHCDTGHAEWPGRPRHNEHTSPSHLEQREDLYALDVDTLADLRSRTRQRPLAPRRTPHVAVVDLDTCELEDEHLY